MKNERLRVLNLEDNQNDSELIHATVQGFGIDCDFVRVEKKEDFLSALDSCRFDLILADYSLPGFGGIPALELVNARGKQDVPFVFVSGEIGEDLAIEALKRGETDYVLKHRLDKLGPAVKRAILEARERADRRTAEEELLRTKEQLERRRRRGWSCRWPNCTSGLLKSFRKKVRFSWNSTQRS